ncbi:MAG TPA: hypothetical protein VNQ90_00215 [Chthoniobacteraceae bacterium]|nr:hypothetical protein [Chthoniobacteraceae bacterium]
MATPSPSLPTPLILPAPTPGRSVRPAPANLHHLRALLAEKFPEAHQRRERDDARAFPIALEATGAERLALPCGVMTEVNGSHGSSALFLERLLDAMAEAPAWGALVDCGASFDPDGAAQRLARLLWVRCHDLQTALKATDLLLRDGNLPLVVLDLQMHPRLHTIPSTTWYRFARMLEPTSTVLVVFTAQATLGAAAGERLTLSSRWSLRALRQRRSRLRLQVERGEAARLSGRAAGTPFNAMDRRIA